MLIEAKPALASLIEAALAAEGAATRRATSAAEALELLGTGKHPDLLILDADVEDDDGLELLRTIKNSTPLRYIPTIVLVGASDFVAVDTAWDYGANCVIRKPERTEELERMFAHLSRFWLVAAVLPHSLRSWAAQR